MNALLAPVEAAYRGVNALRRSLYRRGTLKQRRLPRPVISVGNIAMGGSGKTPTAIAIAEHFTKRGKKAAILTRGYGRSGDDHHAIVDSEDARRFGDEAVLMHQQLPGCDVVVGGDRFESGIWYLGSNDCDLFILDDGFQHLQLARDVDVVIDMPHARWHRESHSALRDADVVLSRDGSAGGFTARLEPSAISWNGEKHELSMLSGKSVFAFAALANNEQFFTMLAALGARLAGSRSFRDHHAYSKSDLERLRRDAAQCGAGLLITTGKDRVKIDDPEVAALSVAMKIEPERDFFALLEKRIAENRGRS